MNIKQITKLRYKTKDKPPIEGVPLLGYNKKYSCPWEVMYRRGDKYYICMKYDAELKHIHRKNTSIYIHENMKQVTRIRYKTEDNPPMANVPLIGYSKKYDCWVALVYRKGDNYYTNMECDVEYKTSPPDEYEYVYP